MRPRRTTIAPEVIDCIAEGRNPEVHELYRVAEHIRADLSGQGPAFAWPQSASPQAEQLFILRAAQVALSGSD